MDIYMIWARDPFDNTKWLIDAWDDDSVSGNRTGYEKKLAKARAEHGADNVVVIRTCVDFRAVEAAFEPSFAETTGAEVIAEEVPVG